MFFLQSPLVCSGCWSQISRRHTCTGFPQPQLDSLVFPTVFGGTIVDGAREATSVLVGTSSSHIQPMYKSCSVALRETCERKSHQWLSTSEGVPGRCPNNADPSNASSLDFGGLRCHPGSATQDPSRPTRR